MSFANDRYAATAVNEFPVDLFVSLVSDLKVVKSIPSAVEPKSAVQKELKKIIGAME